MKAHERLVWVRMNIGRYSTASGAARAMGVPIPTYSGHENGSRGLTQGAAERYARFFRVTPEWIFFGRGEPRAGVAGPPVNDDSKPHAQTFFPEKIVGVAPLSPAANGRLRILGRAGGSPDGRLAMNEGHAGWAAMPKVLEGIEGAYGVFVDGDSMLERYQPGEFLHVNPHRPVKSGDYVVAWVRDADGSVTGYVKRFISRSPQKLVLEQLNPPEGHKPLLQFPGGHVLTVHKVIGTGEP